MILDYHQFTGRHYETGSLHNLLCHQGYELSEALLLGVSGGITVGYFSFAYEGYNPHVALLTRNTFDSFDRILGRLGMVQDVQKTTRANKATDNLRDVLTAGNPLLVWVDLFSLPYTISDRDDDMWLMIPVVVYGHDDTTVYIADRAGVPLQVPAEDFLAARGVVKKTRYQLLAVEDVNMSRLASAVEQGLHDTVHLFTGNAPVKHANKSLGSAGMTRWADCLTKRGDRQSWQKVFPPGPAMYAGLKTTFSSIETTNGPGAERGRFADFLDEAATVIDRPALREVAAGYRELAPLWTALAEAHLPERVPLFAETRDLLRRTHTLFIERGQAAQDERERINTRLGEIRATMDDDFPLREAEAADLRAELAERVLALRDRETAQIEALREALAFE
jgi:hypothetical protein